MYGFKHHTLLEMKPLNHCRGHAVCSGIKTAQRISVGGFTLIELLMTIVIAAILMVVAAPSFMQIRRNAELSDAVSNFITATGTAKSAALKTGRDTYLVVNDGLVGWKSGWFVFIDNNWDQDYNEGTDDVLLRHDELSGDVTVTTPGVTALSSGYLRFNGSGFPKTKAGAAGNGTLVMAITGRSSSIVVDTAGRVRSCKTGSAGC